MSGDSAKSEIWSLEQEYYLTKPLREKLLTEHKLNKRLLALNLVTQNEETGTGDEMPVIDEEELDDADGLISGMYRQDGSSLVAWRVRNRVQ